MAQVVTASRKQGRANARLDVSEGVHTRGIETVRENAGLALGISPWLNSPRV